MPETVLKIELAELTKIRFSAKGVDAEMALDQFVVAEYLNGLVYAHTIEDRDRQLVLEMVEKLKRTHELLRDKLGVSFVLPG